MGLLMNLFIFILCTSIIAHANSQYSSECASGSCYPATGDLLIGRQDSLTASSTCGMEAAVRYCIVSHLKENNRGDVNKCFSCDSRDPSPPHLPAQYRTSHRVEDIVATFPDNGGWWQAENGKEHVHIQLDLGAEFHFTHLIMKFKTFRPSAMLIERSYDFGKTWKVYRYFAYDCEESFPNVPLGPVRNINDVICESRYSGVEPSTKGEVIFRVLPPYIRVQDPYSEEVQDLLKMTNLRVNFTKLHTLGDNLLDSRDEIKEKYYYAMYEMVVRGSCSCYGHASRCVPAADEYLTDPNMVHGQCECTHHTQGRNCEKCQDFYNDQPWRPAQGNNINECQPCDCHSHSDRCHFDPSVYELTGRVSGGVCDHCRDNTTGRQCDECEPFFYLQPSRTIRDRDACRACNCDPVGSEHGGECQGRTDPAHNLVAGRCICKRFVQGERCDICENGYWNMLPDNPEGCEACTCNTMGTVGNYGCDKRTGVCRCKRYVIGRMCDECELGYWGLSEDPEGCQPCDCDPGGSVDGSCDQSTGQCLCKPNIVGRRCDQPQQAYYVADLDYYVYEAELAQGTGRAMIEIRTLSSGQTMTWTGTGFMRVFEGDTLTFNVDNLPVSMDYDIVIRYESQMPDNWEDVRLNVDRSESVDIMGPCANYIPSNDNKQGRLQRGNMYYIFSPSSCLEENQNYDIRIEFRSYDNRYNPDASILIDSIVIVPVVDSLNMYEGVSELQDFHHYRCYDYHLPVHSSDAPETCNGHYFSIGATTEGQGLDCDCDGMGSYSHICNPQGGQCECKPYVIGRRCHQCAPGSYGFSPEGCLPCECNAIGSSSLMCEVTTGQCPCNPNVYGRRCDECQRGFWGYPNCQPCRCNGRADVCDNENGNCRDCRDNTAGPSCSLCRAGFYGDPSPASTIGCRPCMCPGGEGSDYQHGDTCQLDTRVSAVVCDCTPGYTGHTCERCSDNYFGNPAEPGGTCDLCMCNDNVDPRTSGNCDATTGECLKCLYNTEGFSCEQCQAGFYGDATQRNCQSCVCNILGTDHQGGECDRTTGQCPCLNNVEGQACDRCIADHWKIASGMGCEACSCDPVGTANGITQCNEFDGQCPCIPGRGGRDCSECEANFWGDPDDMCVPCECDPDGSTSQQCDRRTGQCVCEDGVAGLHCDICDRGTTGQLPNCMPCGECFDNWDRTITELANMTNQLVQQGEDIKFEGPPGAFDDEFHIMEQNLDEIRRIIAGANITSSDLDVIEEQLNTIRECFSNSSDDLKIVEGDIAKNLLTVHNSNNRIEDLRNKVLEMKVIAQQLKDNATIIRELDVSGAFNSTQESLRRSNDAQLKIDQAADIIQESEDTRDEVSRLIEDNRQAFEDQYRENRNNIYEVSLSINNTHDNITILNRMVCDSENFDEDQCDSQCGGALCGKCGGVSCGDGAVEQSIGAQDWAEKADVILKDLYADTSNMLQDMESAQLDASDAKVQAEEAYDNAMEAKNTSENARDDLQRLIEQISDFLVMDKAEPADIRMTAEMVLNMTISLTSREIEEWAQKINETIKSLTDIDTILDATRDNLNTAQELKRRADISKQDADDVLSTAQQVLQALEEAAAAQDAAEAAIDGATNSINAAESDLTLIEETTTRTKELSNETTIIVDDLNDRMQVLKQTYLENELKVQKAQTEAQRADELARQAQRDASELETNYNDAQAQLEQKYNQTLTAKDRADILLNNAFNLYTETQRKLSTLQHMSEQFTRNGKMFVDLNLQIQRLYIRMITYHEEITSSAEFHRTCTAIS